MLAGFILVGLILVNSWGVISRYLLNEPIDWILDISELMMVGSVFLGTAYIYQMEGHVSVDIVVGTVSEKKRRVLSFVSTLMVLLFSLILVWKTWELSWMNIYTRSSSFVMFPLFPAYFTVFYGSCLLLLQAMIRIYSKFKE